MFGRTSRISIHYLRKILYTVFLKKTTIKLRIYKGYRKTPFKVCEIISMKKIVDIYFYWSFLFAAHFLTLNFQLKSTLKQIFQIKFQEILLLKCLDYFCCLFFYSIKITSKIQITGIDHDPEKIEKFDDGFCRQILNFLQKSLFLNLFLIFENPCSMFHSTQ